MINETNNFFFLSDPDLLEFENIFFDIEETLLDKNYYYLALSNPKFNQIFLSMCNNVKVSEVMYFGKNFRRYLTDRHLPQIINNLKNNGKNVYALTTGYPSELRKRRLEELNIFCKDIIYSFGGDKGPVLVNYITQNNIQGNCCFIDNHIEKINSVNESFRLHFPDRKLTSYLYTKPTKIINISIEKFVNYWGLVIKCVARKTIRQFR